MIKKNNQNEDFQRAFEGVLRGMSERGIKSKVKFNKNEIDGE